jgi:hypothetical protein
MHKKTFAIILVALPFLAATIQEQWPDIVASTPSDVRLNQTQSDAHIKGFTERECVTLSSTLQVDGGSISSGNTVSCHFFHADSVNSPTLEGDAQFDSNILGVISATSRLDASDGVCGRVGTTYPASGGEAYRGLDAVGDWYSVDNNTDIITIHNSLPNGSSDQVRVITACVQ